jgi:hypothetical protein
MPRGESIRSVLDRIRADRHGAGILALRERDVTSLPQIHARA